MNISLALSNVLSVIKKGIPKFSQKSLHKITPVGAGYYAMQHNTSRAGIKYTKLVKRDTSRTLIKKV